MSDPSDRSPYPPAAFPLIFGDHFAVLLPAGDAAMRAWLVRLIAIRDRAAYPGKVGP